MMTTNFYLKEDFKNLYPIEREELLIGKRAAAGHYCWGCRRILIHCWSMNAHSLVHSSLKSVTDFMGTTHNVERLSECPSCGKEYEKEGWNGAVGRELGFNETKPTEKAGVKSTGSFMFALRFQESFKLFNSLNNNRKVIIDEYDKEYTLKEFFSILSECAIQYINEATNWS